MDKNVNEIIQQVKHGKEIFENIFETSELRVNDSFLIVLTENKECIYSALKYLPTFISTHHKRNVYIILKDEQYAELFLRAGGCIKICKENDLKCLIKYFNLFQRKELCDTRILFLTEKDGYGFYVEKLLEKKEFTLDEYVAISLFQLKGLGNRERDVYE